MSFEPLRELNSALANEDEAPRTNADNIFEETHLEEFLLSLAKVTNALSCHLQ